MSDTDRLSNQALYHQLVRLREEMPDWNMLHMPHYTRWVGRVTAVVDATGCIEELAAIKVNLRVVSNLAIGLEAYRTAHAIAVAIDTVIAKLELVLPAEAQGAFIPTGGVFDAFQAVAKAVAAAQHHVLLVDPSADETLIADFVPLGRRLSAGLRNTRRARSKSGWRRAGHCMIA
jgi:hypothetical protein